MSEGWTYVDVLTYVSWVTGPGDDRGGPVTGKGRVRQRDEGEGGDTDRRGGRESRPITRVEGPGGKVRRRRTGTQVL